MFKEQNLQQISFGVPAVVFHNLAKRAAPLNIRPVEYARRLFEAAYAVRVAGERGQETEDGALDHQVRQVFLLADCEPEFIAEALKLPIERVKRMLEGWRQVARELVDPKAETKVAPMPSGQTEDIPPAVAAGGYDPAVIGKLWADGVGCKEIAAAIGKTVGGLSQWVLKHRDVCPARRKARG